MFSFEIFFPFRFYTWSWTRHQGLTWPYRVWEAFHNSDLCKASETGVSEVRPLPHHPQSISTYNMSSLVKGGLNTVWTDLHHLWLSFSLEVKKIHGVRLRTWVSLIFHNIHAAFGMLGFIAGIETSEQKPVKNAIWLQLLLLLLVQCKILPCFFN